MGLGRMLGRNALKSDGGLQKGKAERKKKQARAKLTKERRKDWTPGVDHRALKAIWKAASTRTPTPVHCWTSRGPGGESSSSFAMDTRRVVTPQSLPAPPEPGPAETAPTPEAAGGEQPTE